ncbi:hypothetical protein E0Z10_g5012 [Xylaria hypoxylon]|uniref:Major facilitator superfamily (MFS) profile domain-containing protein n=1 Tax=Xylaria hypoxylon TaxID=37992 RepID=A0A4Z0YX11_9PEZI|nr:hypothetical protein E0Z10_g5012 [Xylaria hypoxylon]
MDDKRSDPPRAPASINSWKLLTNQENITNDILSCPYAGSGTQDSPYIVKWMPSDPVDPISYPKWRKWCITLIMALSTLAITFASSSLGAADPQLEKHFSASTTLVTADVSLFVLAFAVGPAIWGPLSELYGRQYIFAATFFGVTVLSSATVVSNSIGTLLVLRFITAALGSSVITNAAGVIGDVWLPHERGLACGFLAQNAGWRWVAGLIALLSGVCWILGLFLVPETYAPLLLRRRAAKLSAMTGRVYKSQLERMGSPKSSRTLFYTNIVRPWVFLAREPIVLVCSIYIAIIYGTLYLSFAAFPIVFAKKRGWDQGISGLAFIGIAVGQVLGMVYAIVDTSRYKRIAARSPGGRAPPEAWLAPSGVAGVALPVGLFWFAWTNGNNIHWIVCLIGIAPFGFGQVLIFLSISQYLLDAYGIYSASALAANAAVRALFGAAFHLFSGPLYERLGIHWGSSIPAFLTLFCLPVPFLFHRFGHKIRLRCHFSSEAMRVTQELNKKTSFNSDAPTLAEQQEA